MERIVLNRTGKELYPKKRDIEKKTITAAERVVALGAEGFELDALHGELDRFLGAVDVQVGLLLRVALVRLVDAGAKQVGRQRGRNAFGCDGKRKKNSFRSCRREEWQHCILLTRRSVGEGAGVWEHHQLQFRHHEMLAVKPSRTINRCHATPSRVKRRNLSRNDFRIRFFKINEKLFIADSNPTQCKQTKTEAG